MSGQGLRVVMAALPKLTKPSVLGTPFHFQTPPLNEFPVANAYNWIDYTAITGEIHSRPNARALRTATFDTLALAWNPTWAIVQETVDPQAVAKELVAIHDSGTPFELRVFPAPAEGWRFYELHMRATLRALTVTNKDGESDTRYFNVQFVEYVDSSLPDLANRVAAGLPRYLLAADL